MSLVADLYQNPDWGPAPEDSSVVRAWLKSKAKGFGLFIGGEWSPAAESFDAMDPATDQPLAKIGKGSAADIDKAVRAAAEAFPAWSATSGHGRARVLYALARLIQKQSRFLAVLETLDNGKPIRENRDIDIPLAARHFYHHAGWAQLLDQTHPDQEALGVVGQVIPWNFPFLMLAWKIAPALACGNTVVLKPAEHTSLTALYFAELCQEAGVPPGVVNIVTGDGSTGEALVDHPGVAKIAFTGSTAIGRRIRQRTAGSGKALTMELGGKSPFIVLEDADLDGAVEGLIDAIWFNQGEVCCAGSRLLAEEGIADRLVEKIKARLEKLRLGDPLDKSIDMGALVAPVQKQRVEKIVAQAQAEGATVWRPEVAPPATGSYVAPTLLTDLGTSNVAWTEEIFGPVLSVMTFRSLKEAAQLANHSRYGLAAAVWGENIDRALQLAAELRCGVVWVNAANQFDAACPFGGYRESGFGREGGAVGLDAYLKPKVPPAMLPAVVETPARSPASPREGIDRTPKNYIGGKQTRPDGGLTREVFGPDGEPIGRVGDGNRKDIRDAVEAALAAESWGKASPHLRAQVLYYLAENMDARREALAAALRDQTGAKGGEAVREVEAAISRLFTFAAWADKFEGRVHQPNASRQLALSVHEPLGVIGVVCPDANPLLSMISLVAPAIAMGNRVVLVPSERHPMIAAEFYALLDTSDVPAGVINIVTGDREALGLVLAQHDGVDGLWHFGSEEGGRAAEEASAGNMKRTWTGLGQTPDPFDPAAEGVQALKHAVQVKTIWVPYGD
jgi:aldehyde dehydrogenase (NAD+)